MYSISYHSGPLTSPVAYTPFFFHCTFQWFETDIVGDAQSVMSTSLADVSSISDASKGTYLCFVNNGFSTFRPSWTFLFSSLLPKFCIRCRSFTSCQALRPWLDKKPLQARTRHESGCFVYCSRFDYMKCRSFVVFDISVQFLCFSPTTAVIVIKHLLGNSHWRDFRLCVF